MLGGGDTGLLLASWGTSDLRSTAVLLPRGIAHYLKVLQERYLVWRLRMGRMELP